MCRFLSLFFLPICVPIPRVPYPSPPPLRQEVEEQDGLVQLKSRAMTLWSEATLDAERQSGLSLPRPLHFTSSSPDEPTLLL